MQLKYGCSLNHVHELSNVKLTIVVFVGLHEFFLEFIPILWGQLEAIFLFKVMDHFCGFMWGDCLLTSGQFVLGPFFKVVLSFLGEVGEIFHGKPCLKELDWHVELVNFLVPEAHSSGGAKECEISEEFHLYDRKKIFVY